LAIKIAFTQKELKKITGQPERAGRLPACFRQPVCSVIFSFRVIKKICKEKRVYAS
jgi:hypothetical protein